MTDYEISLKTRGTRLQIGSGRRTLLDRLRKRAEEFGCTEIVLPSLEPVALYIEKAGDAILHQIYTLEDRKGRALCLRPEGTATCQLLAREVLKYDKDVKLWYETRCWRYERPQAGRYREFTQFGVEVLNPTRDYRPELILLAERCIREEGVPYEIAGNVKRGLAYYIEDGFEINCPSLGAQKQLVGGGTYAEGIGFAIGLDRLLLAKDTK